MIVGILGAGQLGRMLALAGYPLGLRFRFWEASPEAPAGQLAECLHGPYDDPALFERFVDGLSAITYEWENIDVSLTRRLAERVPVFPPPSALAEAQDRLREKNLFTQLGIPVPPYAAVDTLADYRPTLEKVGFPSVLKTRRMGYDGRGQAVLREPADAERAWAQMGGTPLLLESFVPFDRELSIIAVRDRQGQTAFYPLVENRHARGMLRRSLAPAPDLTDQMQALAQGHAGRVLDRLNYVGVLAIEFFEVDGQLLANEMAPRVHNSGHWTIEGAVANQFENHLRAILGMPLGSTAVRGPTAMVNVIGQLPDCNRILAMPGAHLHLYGKTAKPDRKLGHITLVATSREALSKQLEILTSIEEAPRHE